jgi:hypothetical protein
MDERIERFDDEEAPGLRRSNSVNFSTIRVERALRLRG